MVFLFFCRIIIWFLTNFVLSRVDTWPQALYLMSTRESGDLQAWLKCHHPALCAFQIQLKTSEPKINEYNYQLLVQLLVLKKLVGYTSFIHLTSFLILVGISTQERHGQRHPVVKRAVSSYFLSVVWAWPAPSFRVRIFLSSRNPPPNSPNQWVCSQIQWPVWYPLRYRWISRPN